MSDFLANLWQKIEKWRLDYLAVFGLVAVIFAWVQWTASFPDPDSFYHAKMAELMLARGPVIRDFIWLPLTTLGTAFADHHFFYHLFQLPFVSHWGGLLGTKIASIVLAAAALTVFYALLKSWRVRLALPFALLTATCGVFLFRINLAKATPLALIWAFLALLVWRVGRWGWLMPISALFVWTHGGWPVLLIFAAAFLTARLLAEGGEFFRRPFQWRVAARRLWSWAETRGTIAMLAGLVFGLVVNPFFPANLAFYWEQIVQIAVINQQSTIGVGSEWYPYSLQALLDNTGAVFVVMGLTVLLGLVVRFWSRRSTLADDVAGRTRQWAATLLALIFLLLTLRNRRHAEYLVPLALLAEAMWLTALWPATVELWDRARRERRRLMSFGLAVLCVSAAAYFPLLAARDTWAVQIANAKKGLSWTHYRSVGLWLADNVPAGDIIMTSDWDDFPPLFYWDDRHRYVVGLDPTFLYSADPEMHRIFVEVTTGRQKMDVAATMRRVFGASHALVERDHYLMLANLAADADAAVVYADEEAVVFELNETP